MKNCIRSFVALAMTTVLGFAVVGCQKKQAIESGPASLKPVVHYGTPPNKGAETGSQISDQFKVHFSDIVGERELKSITEARVLVLDMSKWESQAAFQQAWNLAGDSVSLGYLGSGLFTWNAFAAALRNYRGDLFSFYGDFQLQVYQNYARGLIRVNPGLNWVFVGLMEGSVVRYVGGAYAVAVSGQQRDVHIYLQEVLINTPATEILRPKTNSSYTLGSEVTFQGRAFDAEDGWLKGESLKWFSNHDGQIGTDTLFTTTSLSRNVHIISLEATDSGGHVERDSIVVYITRGHGPSAVIIQPLWYQQFPKDSSITFRGRATDQEDGALSGARVRWQSSINGTFGTDTLVTTDSLSIGNHYITLEVTDSDTNVARDWVRIYVTEGHAPVVRIYTPDWNQLYARDEQIHFSGYVWDNEDGSLPSDSVVWASSLDGVLGHGTNFYKKDLTIGTHKTWLTATDKDGYTNSDSVSFTVVSGTYPTAKIVSPAANQQFEEGTQVSLIGSVTDPDETIPDSMIVWTSNRMGLLGRGDTLVVDNLTVGTHYITLRATDSNGLTASDARYITIYRVYPPTAQIQSPIPNGNYYVGDNITFRATLFSQDQGTVSDTSFSWTSSVDGFIGRGREFSHDGLTADDHLIVLTVINQWGRVARDSVTIRVKNPHTPIADIVSPSNGSEFIAGQNIFFSADVAAQDAGTLTSGSFVWTSSLGGQIGTGTSFNRTNLAVGAHRIWLTVTNRFGLSSQDSVDISVADQPKRWAAMKSGRQDTLRHVQFTSADQGWVTGDNGGVIQSLDGGATWTARNIPGETDPVVDGHFIDATIGWALSSGAVYFTSDSGKTWTSQLTIGDVTTITGRFYGISFANSETGWVTASGNGITGGPAAVIYKTTNGGATWSLSNYESSVNYYDIHFETESNGWVVGRDYRGQTVTGLVRSTNSGGSSWIDRYNTYNNLELMAVHFSDSESGIAVGKVYGSTNSSVILRSFNGGLSWAVRVNGGYRPLLDGFVVNSGDNWAVGRTAGEGANTVLRTRDATNWSNDTFDLTVRHDFHGVYFHNDQVGWIVGSDGAIYKTTTGGDGL